MKKVSGIYCITNIINGHLYIGSSINITKRWATHRDRLRRKIHHSKYFERAWHKHGENAFVFNILEELRGVNEVLHQREQEYIDLFKPKYNVSLTAGRLEWTDDLREAHSLRMKGNRLGEKRPEHGKKISGDRNWFYGNHFSEDQKIASSLKRVVITRSQAMEAVAMHDKGMSIAKISNSMEVSRSVITRLFSGKIKVYSDILISPSDKKRNGYNCNRGENNYGSALMLDVFTGIYYGSMREAANAKNINEGTLSSNLRRNWGQTRGLIKV